jgi:hypothetical protein
MPPLATPSVCVCARTKRRLPQALALCHSQNRHFFHLFPPSPCFVRYNQQQSNTQHTTTHHRHAADSLFCCLHKAAGRNHTHVPDSLITNLPQTRTRLTIYKATRRHLSRVSSLFCFVSPSLFRRRTSNALCVSICTFVPVKQVNCAPSTLFRRSTLVLKHVLRNYQRSLQSAVFQLACLTGTKVSISAFCTASVLVLLYQ